MRFSQYILFFVISFSTMVAAHAEGMCTVNETAVFNCDFKRSVSSLCLSAGQDVLTYRNGNNEEINLKISEDKKLRKNIFYFSATTYAGGGEAHIRFSNLGYIYYLYDRTIKTDDGPMFSSGILIYKGEKIIANLACNNDASIHGKAYQIIEREKYRSLPIP